MKKNLLLILLFTAWITSCKKKDDPEFDPPDNLGWYGTDDLTTVPSNVNFGTGGNVPSSYDIVPKFPPIGDQGQYGTCVAWAAGYNMKTALEGMDRGLNSGQLASSANQISPRDLFTAIPDASKGQNCNGTNFTDALDILLQRGAATLQTVPYNNLGSCASAGVQSNWTQEASGHRIKSYRKINLDINTIKENVANNVPVVCGAKLSDNFMTWNNDNVLSSNTTYNNTGQHAYHAMIIAGYDDGKGANGAFRIINSWSTQWGDAGYIWVDYQFFVSQFCFGGNVYIAVNDNGNNPPPTVDTTSSGNVDLATWAFSDVDLGFDWSLGFYKREITYNLYNIGDQPATTNQPWYFYYLYYNAYNANEYGFLFVDELTNAVTAGDPPVWITDHWAMNFDIPGGSDFGTAVFGSSTVYQDYYVPQITGFYYLVLVADGDDIFNENDEQNNIFYTTGQYPATFIDGEVQRSASKSKPVTNLHGYNFKNYLQPEKSNLKKNPYMTAINSTYPNAYSTDELRAVIRQQKKSGEWQRKVQAFKASTKKNTFAARK